MKKWGSLVVLFYMLALAVLTLPVLLCCWAGEPSDGAPYPLWDYLKVFLRWEVLTPIAVMGFGQLLLLFVPVQVAERKLKSRRPLLVPVITAAFMAVVLLAAAVTFITWMLIETKYHDFGSHFLDRIHILWNGYIWVLLLVLAWVFWSVVFYRFTRNLEPDRLMRWLVSWLLKGSILELLVAIPSHIFVRHRKDCCAPMATFWGIAAGIAIMLLSFGPGVFYLFVERVKRSQRAKTSPDS